MLELESESESELELGDSSILFAILLGPLSFKALESSLKTFVGIHLNPLGFLFTAFLLLLKALSDSVAVSDAAAKILPYVLHIILGAVRVR